MSQNRQVASVSSAGPSYNTSTSSTPPGQELAAPTPGLPRTPESHTGKLSEEKTLDQPSDSLILAVPPLDNDPLASTPLDTSGTSESAFEQPAATPRHFEGHKLIPPIPLELVTIIVLYFIQLDGRHQNRPYSMVALLSEVNWAWNEFIHSTPSVWQFVSGFEMGAYPTIVKESADLPLHFRTNGKGRRLKKFLGFISANVRRCASIEMTGDRGSLDEADIAAISVEMPSLITIQLASRRSDCDKHVLHLSASSLVRIRLCGLGFSCNELNPPVHLRSLRLTHLDTAAPSFQFLSDVLRASPQIEELHLEDVNIKSVANELSEPEAATPITLPHLHYFYLRNRNGPMLASMCLFNRIEAPQCRILETEHSSIEPLLSNSTITTTLPMTSSTARITVTYGDQLRASVESSEPQEPYVDFQTIFPWETEKWEGISEMLSFPMANPDVHINFTDNATPFAPQYLSFWTRTRCISFDSGYHAISITLRSLAILSRPSLPGSYCKWICPEVTDLLFDSDIRSLERVDEVYRSVILVLEARNMEIAVYTPGSYEPVWRMLEGAPLPIRFISGSRELICKLKESAFASGLVLKVAHEAR